MSGDELTDDQRHVVVWERPMEFEDSKVAGERIYWDQASVLAQVGLIDPPRLPTTGIEASRKVVDPANEPSNRLIERLT